MPRKITLPPMAHLFENVYDVPAAYAPLDEADCNLFLTKLRQTGIASTAARACGRGEIIFQKLKSENAAFSEAWDWAKREAADVLKLEAHRRAVEGVDKPIYYQGEVVGEVREYSDSLLLALLKADHEDFKNVEDEVGTGKNTAPTQINVSVIPAGQYMSRQAAQAEAGLEPEDE